uniref:Uncharacterized protein n=1 Tax=Arundo donax TaxID=35708 RepID=A0A0A9E8I9_ARUDO
MMSTMAHKGTNCWAESCWLSTPTQIY